MASNNAPKFYWEAPRAVGVLRRRRLFLEGEFAGAYRPTEYFIDTADRSLMRVYDQKHALFASGHGAEGTAKLIGYGNRIDALKHKAEQAAMNAMEMAG